MSNIVFNVDLSNDSSILSNVTFFGNIDLTNEADITVTTNNKNCLIYKDNNDNTKQVIHNMYMSDTCFYKSAIYNTSKTLRTDTTYDFNNITNHKLSAGFINFIQVNNTLYGLEPMTQFGRYVIDTDIYSYISADNNRLLPESSNISTIIYNYAEISAAVKNDLTQLGDIAVLSALTNIEYNMLYEIPGNIYNDYESGNIAANTFKGKNAFDSLYNMDHSNDCILNNARQYKSIGNCNNQVYLTYNDNIKYSTSESPAYKSQFDDVNDLKCDKVEIIDSINRYANLAGHKTNLYSVTVQTNLFQGIDNNQIKENLKKEVQYAVNNIVSKLAPVHTQLLNVVINDIKN